MSEITDTVEDATYGELKKTPAKKRKSRNLSERKSDKIRISKYLQFHGEGIHKYTQAYVRVAFRDIMKTKTEWDEEIKKIMEGDK